MLTYYQMPGFCQERFRPSGIEARSIPRGEGGLPASYEAPPRQLTSVQAGKSITSFRIVFKRYPERPGCLVS